MAAGPGGVASGPFWIARITIDPAHPVRVGAPLTGPASFVWAVAFSPAGTTLAAGVTDGTVHVWDTSPAAKAGQLSHALAVSTRQQ